ncbi:MAG: KpsF/GutQ family sugar-phosphate isomerase [Pseudomonadota bacterium]
MTTEAPLSIASRVIADEGDALQKLASQLDENFIKALETIQTAEGRVIVTGMGKSGHIANKIAATLASTGTPSHFVHPAEASHGDLGMIGKTDVVLALSNSGEAAELSNLLAYTRRFSIPLIAITSRPDGTLAKHSDICLLIPQLGEACGYGVVPSISTTMTLAMGDALAITLMRARGFTSEHFRDFHPGGKLGAKLSKVSDLMHAGEALPVVGLQTKMSDALLEISQKGFGVVAVTDAEGNLAGIITDGDLRRHMDGLLDQTAQTVMTPAPQTITPGSLAETAVNIMNTRKITCLFVTENGTATAPLGLLHIHDCLRAGVV